MPEHEKPQKEEFGQVKIDWLQPDDKRVIHFPERLLALSGAWKNKHKLIFASFWVVTSVIFTFIFIESTFMLVHNLDLVAYCAHHTIIAAFDGIVIVALYVKEEKFATIMEGPYKTYSYGSAIVKDFHRKLMVDKLQGMRFESKCIIVCGLGLLTFLEVCFCLEATLTRTYETLYPMYVPFSTDHPVVYTVVVVYQQSILLLTAVLGIGAITMLDRGWNHLCLELDVFKFALSQVDNLVMEKFKNENLNNETNQDAERRAYELYCYHFAKHHAAIRRYFHTIQECVIHFTTHLVLGGLVCFVCIGITSISENTTIKVRFFCIFVVQLSFIYGWCWISQDVFDKAEEIIDVVASIPWWKMNKKCRSTLLLIMVGSKIPLVFTTTLGHRADKESYMDMLANSYRCFNLVYQAKS